MSKVSIFIGVVLIILVVALISSFLPTDSLYRVCKDDVCYTGKQAFFSNGGCISYVEDGQDTYLCGGKLTIRRLP